MTRNTILALACVLGFARGASAEILARISVLPTDLGGTPITSIALGEDFRLQAIVQDLRDPPPELGSGTFAAYLNATYNPGLMSIAPSAVLEFDPFFNLVQTGDLSTPGLISGAGAATTTFSPPGNDPQPLWNVLITAIGPGVVSFIPSFDTVVTHDVLLYLKNEIVLESEIDFVGSSLTIVPEPSGFVLGTICIVGMALWTATRRRSRRTR